MNPEPPLRPLELLGVLLAHEVEFVVIGGFSLAAHGVIRGTKDIDIVPEPSEDNLVRLADALTELDAEVLGIEEFDRDEHVGEPTPQNLALGGNWVLKTRHGRLDIMQYVSGAKSYERLRAGAVQSAVPGLDRDLWFAGLHDLVAMKHAAGREQDLLDIADLERARGAAE